MPLFKDLIDLYDEMEKTGHPDMQFPSVWHEEKSAGYEVAVDLKGNFVSVRKIEKFSVETNGTGKKIKVPIKTAVVTPVTAISESRTGYMVAPRPLLEKVKYVAGDLDKYVNGDFNYYHINYTAMLENWCHFSHGNEKLSAILAYVKNDTLAGDLLAALDGELTEKKLPETTIRFIVKGADPEEPWKDKALMGSWDRYMERDSTDVILDQCTGTYGRRSFKQPKNIMSENPNGKLISVCGKEQSFMHMVGNRFSDPEKDAPNITIETSAKVHRMLRWLITNRSIKIRTNDGCTVWTCFASKDPRTGMFEYINHAAGYGPADQGQILQDLAAGKNVELPRGKMTIVALDYASPGRDSIVYYESADPAEFFSRIQTWRDRYGLAYESGKKYHLSLRSIATHAYGNYTTQNGFTVKDAVMKKAMCRLMECMLTGRPVPDDIVHMAVDNVSRTAHWSKDVHDQVLQTARILVAAKDRYRIGEGQMPDVEKSRSYLYGRLLATYEWYETAANYKRSLKTKKKIDRPTNARKLWQACVSDPEKMVPRLHERVIRGYSSWLSPKSQKEYQYILDDIYSLIDEASANISRHRPLDETYLLGYTYQRGVLKKRSEEKRTSAKKEDA